MEIRVIGIDLGKSVFHLVGMDKHGKVVVRANNLRGQDPNKEISARKSSPAPVFR
jgi:hypothetical protein